MNLTTDALPWITLVSMFLLGVPGLLFTWVVLRPDQRQHLRAISSKMMWKLFGIIQILYVLWINISFLQKDEPIRRIELLILLMANAQWIFFLILIIVVRMILIFSQKRDEAWLDQYKDILQLSGVRINKSLKDDIKE